MAGTFARKKDADRAWQAAEVRLAGGRLGDPRRGRQTFRRYVEEEWLPNHVMEATTTREGYTYSIYKHVMPWFGSMRMNQIMPAWLSRPGARCRNCFRSVSPGRSPNPPCRSPGSGLSTVSAVRRGRAWSRDWGS